MPHSPGLYSPQPSRPYSFTRKREDKSDAEATSTVAALAGYRHGASCTAPTQLRHPGRGGYNRYQRTTFNVLWFWVVALVVAYGTPVYAAPGCRDVRTAADAAGTGRDYRIRLRWRKWKRRPHRILYVYAVPIILRVAETKEEGRRLPDPAGPCPCDQRTGAGSRAQPSGGGKIRPSPGSASEISAPVRGTRTPVW